MSAFVGLYEPECIGMIAAAVVELLLSDHDSLRAVIKAGTWSIADAAKRTAWFTAPLAEHERQRRRMRERRRLATTAELAPISNLRFFREHPVAAHADWFAIMAAYIRRTGKFVPFECTLYGGPSVYTLRFTYESDGRHATASLRTDDFDVATMTGEYNAKFVSAVADMLEQCSDMRASRCSVLAV